MNPMVCIHFMMAFLWGDHLEGQGSYYTQLDSPCLNTTSSRQPSQRKALDAPGDS